MIISSKKYFVLLFSLVVLFGACGCEKPKLAEEPQQPEEQVEPADMSLIEKAVVITDDCLWSGKPQVTIHITNPNVAKVKVEVKGKITSDMRQVVTEVLDSIEIAGKSEVDYVLTTEDDLAPGFYKANCYVEGKNAGVLNFGIDVFDIVSEPDKQPDYDQFWQTAKEQLAAIDMQANLIELPNKSTAQRKVYLVELRSVPDGLEGEPVIIRGYYCEPQDDQKHPVLMHFYGYDSQNSKTKVECPSGNGSNYAEFYLSHRGQYINNRPESSREPDGLGDLVNIYGDWCSYEFGHKDSYYYRGAFMDCVRAVDFMATRATSDMDHLFAEGSSQGGALSYAAAALSNYPFTAICANVAFLGDFPDYFQIVDWPGSTAKAAAKAMGMTDEEMYAFLSYFDTKNLATRISCGVLATSGGKDTTCPPHTNIAPYNNLLTPAENKEYHFYPEMTHDYPKNWWTMIENFRKKFM